ncbi:MAG TPA: DUF4430 domain-containing protein [Gaiellaceae bacterium]|nr:DUF4430 domain-containing protein [Gaiellaceae bacterium]
MRRLLLVPLLAVGLAACGGSGHGKATLWITRDEGHTVLLAAQVPAGETAMQALERSATVSTRYGGRFVQSVNGLAGSISSEHDWFYFVNGIEGTSGAVEYRLRPGDVEWWDYRDWGTAGETVPVVVGAFPEPFLHGFGGRVRQAVVIGPGARGADAVAKVIHGRVAASAPRDANVLRLLPPFSGPPRFTARLRPGGGVVFDYTGDPRRLARDPGLARYRYRLP